MERGKTSQKSAEQLSFALPARENLSSEGVFMAGRRKNMMKSSLGRGYNLRIKRQPRNKRDTRALEHPWAN